MFKIMVVEDDVNTRKLMGAVLGQNGYEAILAENGIAALEIMDSKHVDLILLDIMMPGMDGYEFTRTLRENDCNIPILMVTARETIDDKKRAFRLGADDYMVKPLNEDEMLLRIEALLRRAHIASDRKITVGQTVLDYDAMTLCQSGQSEILPQKEFLLLFKLLSYPNKIFTRRQLMDEIWDMDSESDERTVDVHVNRLRERLKGNEDLEIITVRGLGYKAVKK